MTLELFALIYFGTGIFASLVLVISMGISKVKFSFGEAAEFGTLLLFFWIIFIPFLILLWYKSSKMMDEAVAKVDEQEDQHEV